MSIELTEEIKVFKNNTIEILELPVQEDVDFYPEIKGFLLPLEKRLLYYYAKNLKQKSVIVEIGCYHGRSTYFLCLGALKNNSKVYSIDPFNSDKSKQERKEKSKFFNEIYKEKPSKKKVEDALKKKHLSNFTLVEGFSSEVSKRWDKKINLLFIDGNHSYEEAKKDLREWALHLTKGGILMIHDSCGIKCSGIDLVGLPGPTKVAEEFLKPPKWINIIRVGSMSIATKNI